MMKRNSSAVGIMRGLLVAAIVGLLLVNFSLAQTSHVSRSPMLVPPLESTDPTQFDQPLPEQPQPQMPPESTAPSSTPEIIPEDNTSPTSTTATEATSTQEQSDTSTPTSTSPLSSTASSLPLQSSQASSTPTSTPPLPPPPPQPTDYPVCGNTIKNVPGDYRSIQAAIHAADIGDTVQIATGTYNENVTLKSGICLEGAGIDQAIISKSGVSGITINNLFYVIVKNLTVRESGCLLGACGVEGGGFNIVRSTDITLESVRIAGNTAVNGGGVFVSSSSVILNNAFIEENTAHNIGGAIVAESNATVTLTNTSVANNHWFNPLGNGGVGGIQLYGSSMHIINSTVENNAHKDFSGEGFVLY